MGVATSLRRDDVPGRSRVHRGGMIEVTSLTKRYGETVAVDDLSFTVRPGIVTGFLGPNGAGKSTTMRVINGLDPEGIRWIRNLLKELAAEGRTVFVSSHLMSEMALTAEHFIIIGRGRLIADVSAAELAAMGPPRQVLVRTPHGDRLRPLLAADGAHVTGDSDRPDAFYVTGMETEVIGRRLMAGGGGGPPPPPPPGTPPA